jgi:hypothetical protein
MSEAAYFPEKLALFFFFLLFYKCWIRIRNAGASNNLSSYYFLEMDIFFDTEL